MKQHLLPRQMLPVVPTSDSVTQRCLAQAALWGWREMENPSPWLAGSEQSPAWWVQHGWWPWRTLGLVGTS